MKLRLIIEVAKVASNQDVFSAILPDFANLEGEKRKTTESSSFSQRKEETGASEMVMELPEVSYEHLKEMTGFTVQELERDRLALAQKVAYTFRVKRKIPGTTPEYYRVNTFFLV